MQRILFQSALHPSLFALFFVLRGFYEIQPYAELLELGVLLVVSLLVSYLAVKVLETGFHNRIKGAILASVCLLLLLHFGEIQNELREHGHAEFARYRYWGPLVAAIVSITSLSLLKSKSPLYNANACLNLISLSFVIIELVNISTYRPVDSVFISQKRAFTTEHAERPNKRDIYYVIFDSYTSNRSLQKFWNEDNSEVTKFLSKNGFVVAENSRSNYNVTPYSLASSMNMSYLNVNDRHDFNLPMRVLPLRELIRRSSVVKHLQSNGYQIVNLSPFALGDHEPFYSCEDLPDFYRAFPKRLFNKTFAGAVYSYFFVQTDPQTVFRIRRALHEQITSRRTVPKFVYAHFMIPRSPLIFTKEGHIKGESEWGPQDLETRKAGYIEQVMFANALITEFVRQIMSAYSENERPVFIIQGDHGSWMLEGEEANHENITIFNALLLPGASNALLNEKITPVNSFRIVFNHLALAQLPLLDDVIFEIDTSYTPRLSDLSAARAERRTLSETEGIAQRPR